MFLFSSCYVQLSWNPMDVTCQIPLPMAFSRREYWSRLPFPSPGDLVEPGIESTSLLCPWDYLGKNAGVGCHALLQEIFPNPGINPTSLTSPALAGRFFATSATWEAQLWPPTLWQFAHLEMAWVCRAGHSWGLGPS